MATKTPPQYKHTNIHKGDHERLMIISATLNIKLVQLLALLSQKTPDEIKKFLKI